MKREIVRAILISARALTGDRALAVIVGGTNGGGFDNAGESTLQAFLSDDGKPACPYWNNLVRYSDASGIYLGYNPATMRGWVLSASHIVQCAGDGTDADTTASPAGYGDSVLSVYRSQMTESPASSSPNPPASCSRRWLE